MIGLSYQEYINWHKSEYSGWPPKAYLLKKYYPNEFREEDAEPEEVKIEKIKSSIIDFKFGHEAEDI